MRIVRLRLRDFRSYSSADVRVGPGVTVVHGRNGAGKTNLLEALYVGCTGASWRTASDRELVRFGAEVARVELDAEAEDGRHAFSVGLEPGTRKRLRADGVAVDRLADVAHLVRRQQEVRPGEERLAVRRGELHVERDRALER